MTSSTRVAAALAVLLTQAACGSDPAPEPMVETTPPPAVAEEPTAGAEVPDDGATFEGLVGTIPRARVESTMRRRMRPLLRCFTRRMDDVEVLGGSIQLDFHVALDGSVAAVHPRASDIGDRATERCVLGIARDVTFPRPNGGEADVSWGFELDPAEDVRPPVPLSPQLMADETMAALQELRSTCGARGRFTLTFYLAPGGTLMAAGGTFPDQASEGALDCVLDALQEAEVALPDPGSYPGKLSLELP
jgi:hypothetical protein